MQFWFEFASTYSYLSAMTVGARAAAAGVEVEWRPFLLGPLFQAQGWNDSPFNIYPAKGAYMWRDLERCCRELGLPLRRPDVFPRNGLLAARVATAAGACDWAPEFVRRVYSANFAKNADISDPAIVSAILANMGQDPGEWLAAAGAREAKDLLKARTEEARSLGIFGAPSFVVGGELFWGHDRLDRALEWARGAR